MTLQSTKIWRDLWINRARTTLIVLAIAIGVAAFGLMNAGRAVLDENLRDGFADSHPAQAILVIPGFEDTLARTVRTMQGVEAAEGRLAVQTRIETMPGEWNVLEIQAVPDVASLTINRITFEPGTTGLIGRGEILLERDISAMMAVDQGDDIRVKTLDDKIHTLRVAGFFNDLSRLPSSISLIGYGFVRRETITAWDIPDSFNRLYVITDSTNRAGIEKTVTTVVERVEDTNQVIGVAVPEPGKPVMGDNMASVLSLLGTMGLLTLTMSAFLIVNVMSAVIAQQIPQIGILKSMGAKTGRLIWLYFRLVLIFGVLGLLLSVPIGAIGAYFLADGMANGMNFNVTRFWLPPSTLALQASSAILVPLFAASIPILTGASITIRDAISGMSSTGSARRGPIDWLIQRLEGLPQLARLSLRNTFRSKARLVLTFAALSLAGAMFIGIIGVRQALFRAVTEIQDEASYDVSVDFARPHSFREIAVAMRGVAGVVDYEAWAITDGRIVFNNRLGGSITLIGVPDDTSMVRPSITQGEWLQPGKHNQLFVNADTLSLAPNLSEGSEVLLDVLDDRSTWTIVGVGTRGFTPIAYIPYADFEEISGQNRYASRVVVRTVSDRPEFQQEVEQALLNSFTDHDMVVINAVTTTERNETSAAQLDILIVLLMAMVVLITVVGGLGLAITMSLNVLERTREIGLLRSLGAKKGVIRRVVLVEGIVIGVLSWGIGSALSIPLGASLGNMLGEALLARPLNYLFTVPPVAAWLGMVIAISALASLAPAEGAARLTIRDTLAYE